MDLLAFFCGTVVPGVGAAPIYVTGEGHRVSRGHGAAVWYETVLGRLCYSLAWQDMASTTLALAGHTSDSP